jgi:type I restriction enzyme R subunit
VAPAPGKTKTETYEDQVKERFVNQPAQMRLLIVVDKLLTGFDAPPCTYLYLDKSMQDHGLFQAICRTNRLDGEDKDFGYIVDYKDLFNKVENAIAVYTSELDHSAGGAAPEVLMQDRLTIGRERLDNALEALALLCEPVEPPQGELEHIHYFCGNSEIASDLEQRAPRRAALYKAVASLVRAFANIADELQAAGYGGADIARIKRQVEQYVRLREIIRNASSENLDLKAYEADMRHLIDTYIQADEPRKISHFDGVPLVDLIVKTGIAEAIAERLGGLQGNEEAIAETIENNVRSRILKEQLSDPAYFAKMSALLDEIIAARRARAIEYEEFLKRIAELAQRVDAGHEDDTPEPLKRSPALRAVYHSLVADGAIAERRAPYQFADNPALELAIVIDRTVRAARPDDWRDNGGPREEMVKAALYGILHNVDAVERIFPVIKAQPEY